MKFLTDLLPIIAFFIVYKFFGIYAATVVAIAASLLIVAVNYMLLRKVDPMQWATLVIVTVLGSATLFLHNELFIKWKPTVIEWTFALVFLLSQWCTDKPVVQRILENNIKLPAYLWKRLNISWAIFFILMGALNVYVLYHFDTNTWVNFKLFGMLACSMLFIILQAFYISKYLAD